MQRLTTPDFKSLEEFDLLVNEDWAFRNQCARLNALLNAVPKETLESSLSDVYAEIGRRQADLIANDVWGPYEHAVETFQREEIRERALLLRHGSKIVEQRTLALAHVLRDHLEIDLGTYDRLLQDAHAGRPVVAPNTVSEGIVEPRLTGTVSPESIAAWRRECDIAVEAHRDRMYRSAADLDRQAGDCDRLRGFAEQRMREHAREGTYQTALLSSLASRNDGSESFKVAIETTRMRKDLAALRTEQSTIEAQSQELSAESLRSKAEALRRQADYDVEASKIARLGRVETAIGRYWTKPELCRNEQLRLLAVQKEALSDAVAAQERARTLWASKEISQDTAAALEEAITTSRIELDSMAMVGVRIQTSIQAQATAPESSMVAQIRANLSRSFEERMANAKANSVNPSRQQATLSAGQSKGVSL